MGRLKWIILQEGKLGLEEGIKERKAERQSMVFPPEFHGDLC